MKHQPFPLRVLDALRIASLTLSGVALVILIAVFGWLVYGRYVLNATPTWVEQLSLLLIIIITFLGAAVGVAEKTHLSVEYLREMVPHPVGLVLHTLSDLLMMSFGALMAFYSFELVTFGWADKIPLLDIPEGVRSLPATICGVLIVLFSLSHIIMRFAGGSAEAPPSIPSDPGAK